MRPVGSLWRFTFTRVAASLILLLLMMGSAGYFLVTRPALERHARALASNLVPTPRPDCNAVRERIAQLALNNSGSGVRIVETRPADAAMPSGWLLPFDAMLISRLRERAQVPVEARSAVDALYLHLSCGADGLELALDRRIALGAAPDLALLAWLGGFLFGALGLAAWLSRALNAPLRHLVSHVRATPLGLPPEIAKSSGIAELDQLTLEVDALRERSSEAVASRTALLMGLSHDLRNPLTRVRLILDTVQPVMALDIAEMKSHLIEMQEAMDEFMRAANAMATPPVAAGAQMVWSRLQSVFRDPRLSFSGEPGTFQTALNSAALLRIASNLIDNALRHGEGRVDISWQQADENWCLCVADEGPGIASHNMARALRAFGSDPTGRDEAHQHAGVGLALARILCEHNGWVLHIASGKPRGLIACVAPSAAPQRCKLME